MDIQLSETEEFHENIEVSEQINRGGNFLLAGNKLYGAGISFYITGGYATNNSTITLYIIVQRYNDLIPGAIEDVSRLAFFRGPSMKMS